MVSVAGYWAAQVPLASYAQTQSTAASIANMKETKCSKDIGAVA